MPNKLQPEVNIFWKLKLIKNSIVCFQLVNRVRLFLLFQFAYSPKKKKINYPFPYKIFIVLYFKRKNQINSILKGTLKM